jgi:G3E family GTPase
MDLFKPIIEELLDNKDYQKALDLLKQLRKDFWVLDYLALSYNNLGLHSESLEISKLMIQKQPDNLIGYHRCYYALGKLPLEQHKELLLKVMQKINTQKKKNILLLAGFLGSGKTTFINYILQNNKSKIMIIVNDLAQINVDSHLIKKYTNNLIELHNGCICCNLQEPFIQLLNNINEDIDLIIVEPTGVSTPDEVFYAVEKLNNYNIVGSWTFVSAEDMLKVIQFKNEIIDNLPENLPDEDNKNINHLIIEQIEFANTIVLNKIDLVNKDELDSIHNLLKELNPKANIIKTNYSKVDLPKKLNTIHSNDIISNVGWLYKLKNDKPETEIYSINSFVYTNPKAFRCDDFINFMKSKKLTEYNIVRVKGFFWIPNHNRYIWELNIAGSSYAIRPCGVWWEGMTPEEQQNAIKETDREQKIVFIGVGDIQKEKIIKYIDSLLTDETENKNECCLTQFIN